MTIKTINMVSIPLNGKYPSPAGAFGPCVTAGVLAFPDTGSGVGVQGWAMGEAVACPKK